MSLISSISKAAKFITLSLHKSSNLHSIAIPDSNADNEFLI